MRDDLNRQLDLLEANQKTPAEMAALLARVKATPGKAYTLDELLAELGLPKPTGERPKVLQVTVRHNGRGVDRVMIGWPDGTVCAHPSLADARTCPKAVAS